MIDGVSGNAKLLRQEGFRLAIRDGPEQIGGLRCREGPLSSAVCPSLLGQDNSVSLALPDQLAFELCKFAMGDA